MATGSRDFATEAPPKEKTPAPARSTGEIAALDAPNGYSLETTMLPLGAIARRIRHQPGRLDRSAGSERDDGVVTLAMRAMPEARNSLSSRPNASR
jgi:hypothetical protein